MGGASRVDLETVTTNSSDDATESRFEIDAVDHGRSLLLVGTPLALAATLWVHPTVENDVAAELAPVVDTWLQLHLLLLALFGLLGVALYLLLGDFDGPTASVGRAGVATYLVAHTAYEAIAGVGIGLLVRASTRSSARASPDVAAVTSELWSAPLLGALALVGTAGALVAVVAAALLLRGVGAPLVPVALLVGAPAGLVFHGAVPAGSIAFVLFALGVAWLEYRWDRSSTGSSGSRP